MVECIVRKLENASQCNFLLFPCFQKLAPSHPINMRRVMSQGFDRYLRKFCSYRRPELNTKLLD